MGGLVDAWGKVGALGLLLIVVLYIALKHLVPYCKDYFTKEQAFRHEQATRAQDRHDAILKDLTVAVQSNTSLLGSQATAFNALTSEIRTTIVKRRERS